MDYPAVLAAIAREVSPHVGSGAVAQHIPALARVPASRFGMAVRTVEGATVGVGDADLPFSMQSISQVFSPALALHATGSAVLDGVGREPSGKPFNALTPLEREEGRPRNPFINAGAIRMADLLCPAFDDPKRALQDLGQRVCGQALHFDVEVAASERAADFRHAALAHVMKSFGQLENDVDRVPDVCVHRCAIAFGCHRPTCGTCDAAVGQHALEGFVARTGLSVF